MIVCTMHIKADIRIVKTAIEVLEVTACDGRPDGFCKSDLTREGTVLHDLWGIEILSPEVGLCTLDVMTLIWSDSFGDRIVVVDLLKRSIAADSYGLDLGVTLIVVYIEATATRGHDHVVTHIGRLDTTIFTTPAHDGSRRSKATFEDLIPADKLLPMLSKHLLSTADDVALELVLILQTFSLDALLAVGTFLPAILRTLVPTDVEVFAREEGYDFVEYILDELKGRLLTSAIDIIFDTPNITYDILTTVGEAGKLRVRGDSTHTVTWHLNLRDDRHKAILSIADDLADLILRIEATVATAISFDTPSTDLGQAGILLDLNTPALVLCEVPVELIDLEHGDDIDVLLHLVYREEVAAYIDHHTAILEGRLIRNTNGRDRPSSRGKSPDLACRLDLRRE